MGVLFHNFGWKLLSVIVAFGLWLVVMSTNSIEITKEVDLILDLPPGLVVSNEVATKVSFRLQGSKLFLRTLANSLEAIRVDLSSAQAGPTFYRIERDVLRLPIGIKILSISPSSINPVLEPLLSRTVPIQVNTRSKVPAGFKLVKLEAIPAQVSIVGPRSQVEKISFVRSGVIDLGGISASLKWEQAIEPPTPQITFSDSTPAPKVIVEVEPLGSNFRIAGVPLQVVGGKGTLNVDKVALYVSCPAAMLKTLTPDKVKASVSLDSVGAGIYLREVKVDLPSGVKLVRVVPDRVQIQVE